jgi:hypothetical protein
MEPWRVFEGGVAMLIEQRVRELKDIIAGNDGQNAADRRFSRAVDELLSAAYDDIGSVTSLPARALFDLFVIKVLYVGRQSRDAAIIEYIAAMLEAYIDVRRLFPADEVGRPRRLYYSDMLDPQKLPLDEPDVYEAYRRYADSALFLSGVFPASLRSRARAKTHLRRRAAPTLDAAYYVATGKDMYRMAARHHHSECSHAPRTLAMLGDNFELYADALNEMSERYISGFDFGLIADKMLDAMNAGRPSDASRYRTLITQDQEPS